MHRMRTAQGVLAIIKADDPETAVTLRYIRRLIHAGEVPVTAVGTKKLVDADKVIEYIAAGSSAVKAPPSLGVLRRVVV